MSVIQNNLLLAGDDAFDVTNSLRFRSSATPSLLRTFGTPTNQKIWTYSFWFKRGTLSVDQGAFIGNNNGTNQWYFRLAANNTLQIGDYNNDVITTTPVYRDPSAWYHIVLAIDTTQATATNRIKLYVNSVQQSYTQGGSFPSQNSNPPLNQASLPVFIGNGSGFTGMDGYMAEVNFVDGQALTPSSFGATNAATGVWQPKAYTGAYGTNGFYLPMNQSDLLKTFQRSLRFRASNSAGLSRTYSNTRTSGTTITYSTWIKRGVLGSGNQTLFFGYDGSSAATSALAFSQDGYNDQITFQFGGSSGTLLATTPVYRDPAAWYHIVLAIDTTQATNTNRVKLYVNGVQVTSFANTFYPSQNATHQFLLANANNGIGYRKTDNAAYFDGYMAEVNCVDGFALTPYSFGQIDDTTGAWQPITYTGQYGTNGFYLPFTDTTSTTTLGNDSSGKGNNWTTNNISLTAGATYDSMTDVPTLTSATAANFAVMNPIDSAASTKPQYANLRLTNSNSTHSITRGTIGVTSGKWYWETTVSSTMANFYSGVATDQTNISSTTTVGGDAYSWAYVGSNGEKRYNSSSSSYGSALVNGDVLGCALDLDSGKIYWSINGTWQGSGNPSAGTNPAFTGVTGTCFPAGGTYNMTIDYNFGQRPFAYTPPTGFVALNAYNI